MSKFVALSLSLGVSDILSGRVKEEDVAFFVTSTYARSEEDWSLLIEDYMPYRQWAAHPERAKAIIERFRSKGLMFQPRVDGLEMISYNPDVIHPQEASRYDNADCGYYPLIPLEAWNKHYAHAYPDYKEL